jgi:putative MATE family efflux protein
MVRNMTEGAPFPQIIKFALPLMAGNLLQETYNVADGAIVGRILGADALASVGATSSVQFLILGFCIGVCSGFAVPIARHFGAGDERRMRQGVWHGAILTTAIAAALTLVCALLCHGILRILSTPSEIYTDAYHYLFIIILGIPFTLLYNYLAGILRAVGDSRTPFLFLVLSTSLNIALDLFCIAVLKLGVPGAAAATITSQGISGLLCLLLIRRKFEILHIRKEDRSWSSAVAKSMAGMGIPMGLQYSVTAIGSMVMQAANNGLGTVYISAYAAGYKLKHFAMCPLDALGTALCTYASQNLGAGKPDRVRKGVRIGIFLSILYGTAAGLVLVVFGRQISMIFVTSDASAVLDASALFVKWCGLFLWLVGVLMVFRYTVQGLGYTFLSVFSGAIEMAARILMSVLLVPAFGYIVICLTDQAAWICAAIYSSIIYTIVIRRVTRMIRGSAKKS